MLKTIILYTAALSMVLLSCNNNKFKTDKTGLEYRFINEYNENQQPSIGDIVVLKMKFTDNEGNIIEESALFKTQLKKASHKGGCIEDAISMMHKGDSAIFRINTNNFYAFSKNQEVPEHLKNTDKLTFHLKLADIINKAEYEKELELAKLSNKRNEEAILSKYIDQQGINVEPSMSGLYFIELQTGSGKSPAPGKKVTVHYKGYFLNNEVFDSSYERNEPFEFYFGIGKVIQGWDEGIARMKIGGKYQLIIPSYLAYGDKQVGPIPPYSTLIFDIELIDCEN